MTKQQPDTWTGCYDLGWQNLISPESFSHPAKFSRGLIFRIIEHALEDGLIQPGSIILDPFGGVALGALPALQNGLNWIGVELESKFVELGRQNIALWNSRFSGMPKWTGQAQLLQGDSRRLVEVVSGAGLVVSSPPYAESINQSAGANDTEARIERMRKAGIDVTNRANVGGPNGVARQDQTYGQAAGQLGAMKPGTPPTAVISSPSFAGNSGGRGDASRNGIDAALFDRHSGGMKKGTGSDPANLDHLPMGTPPIAIVSSPPYADVVKGGEGPGARSPKWVEENCNDYDIATRDNAGKLVDYGSAEGQLGAMKAGVAVVGSPPFEGSDMRKGGSDLAVRRAIQTGRNPNSASVQSQATTEPYGNSNGQLANDSGQTFWEAARLIVEQCALLLPPGGAAIWVTKRYIKAGKIVDFSQQWAALCEACGFEVVHWHRAMLVKDGGTQADIFGNDHKKTVAKKSFFRRLAEKNGSPPIDWEDVICTRKPA